MKYIAFALFGGLLLFIGGCAESISPNTYLYHTVRYEEAIQYKVIADRDPGSGYGESRYSFSRMAIDNTRKSCSEWMAQDHVYFKHRLYYSRYEDRTYSDYNSTMCLLDVSVQLRYSDNIPVYRVIFTPRRHISQQAINKLPPLGAVKQRRPHTMVLPFKLPDDRKLVRGQLYTDWTYCAACLTGIEKQPTSEKALGEYFRKLNERIFGGVDHYDGKEFLDYTSEVEFFRPKDDRDTSYVVFRQYRKWMYTAAKFNTQDALLARSKLISLKKIDEQRRDNAVAGNESYQEFISKTYEPLTAKYYIRHQLHCGDYEYRNKNRSARENAKYIPMNQRYLRCLTRKFNDYDLKGYIAKYPGLKQQEADLWDKSYGIPRTKIGTPDDQAQAFNKRYKDIENETKDMVYYANRAAENAAAAERSRQGWANVFNNAMANIRQDNQFIADHGLVVNSDNTVTTVKQARENAIQAAKMQAALDSARQHSHKHRAYAQSRVTVQDEHREQSHQSNNSHTGPAAQMQPPTHRSTQKAIAEAQQKTDRIKQAEEKRAREKRAKEKQAQEEAARKRQRLEQEKRAREKRAREKAARERIVHNVVLTWRSKSGKWYACGPVQCTQGEGDNTEQEAMDYVLGKPRHTIVGSGRYYSCYQYATAAKWIDAVGDASEASIRRRANCRIGKIGNE